MCREIQRQRLPLNDLLAPHSVLCNELRAEKLRQRLGPPGKVATFRVIDDFFPALRRYDGSILPQYQKCGNAPHPELLTEAGLLPSILIRREGGGGDKVFMSNLKRNAIFLPLSNFLYIRVQLRWEPVYAARISAKTCCSAHFHRRSRQPSDLIYTPQPSSLKSAWCPIFQYFEITSIQHTSVLREKFSGMKFSRQITYKMRWNQRSALRDEQEA